MRQGEIYSITQLEHFAERADGAVKELQAMQKKAVELRLQLDCRKVKRKGHVLGFTFNRDIAIVLG